MVNEVKLSHSRHTVFKLYKTRKFPPKPNTPPQDRSPVIRPVNSTPRLHKRLSSESSSDYPLLRLSCPPEATLSEFLRRAAIHTPSKPNPHPNVFKSLPPTPSGSQASSSTKGNPTMSTSAVPQSTSANGHVSRAKDNDIVPAKPQTPSDPEQGYNKTVQVNGESNSPKSTNAQAQGPLWNAAHPCYPHANPHVPASSPLIHSTRVIRVPRNWMAAGDLYPAFSNIYPEILAPWVPEVDFRKLVEGLNARLATTFDPTGPRAWVDGVMGCLSGWIWEDLGLNKSKSGMRDIERFIDKWNQERTANSQAEDVDLVQCIQLRRTGFLSIDIVIPDPKVMVVNEAQIPQSQAPTSQP